MNTDFLNCLKKQNIAVKTDEPMKNHTSFRIGGKAAYFISPSSEQQCVECIEACNRFGIDLFIIGKGTNLLVTDKNIDIAFICISSEMSAISLLSETDIVCEAGASLASVCKFALEKSLSGMEFSYGIPGNVGGALAMNAGAYGGEIKDIAVFCRFVDDKGRIFEKKLIDEDLSYRHSFFSDKNYCITSVTLNLSLGNRENIMEKMNDFITRRKEKQPLDLPSAGSTFKRPEGNFASKLIEECGLKGFRIGGAAVSEKHAGFVVNSDNASFDDVEELIKKVSMIVFEKTGYKLEPEVKILK